MIHDKVEYIALRSFPTQLQAGVLGCEAWREYYSKPRALVQYYCNLLFSYHAHVLCSMYYDNNGLRFPNIRAVWKKSFILVGGLERVRYFTKPKAKTLVVTYYSMMTARLGNVHVLCTHY
jgi:hypothetical protein